MLRYPSSINASVIACIGLFLTLCGKSIADTPIPSSTIADSSKSDSLATALAQSKPLAADKTVAQAWKRVAWHTLAPTLSGALFSGITAAANTGLEGGGAPFIIYGLLIGPSMGNVYLDDYSGAFSGGVNRLGGAAIGLFGLMVGAVCSFSDSGNDSKGNTCLYLAAPIMLGGAAVATFGTLKQLQRLPEAAAHQHRASQRSSESSSSVLLAVMPLWNPQRNALGLNLVAAY